MLMVGLAGPALGAGHFEGWVCGGGDAQGGLLLATTNGTDWARQGIGQLPLVGLSAVCSSGTGNVWVVGDVEGEYAAIYYSSDSGMSWSRQGDASSMPSNVLQKVCVVQTQVVWAVGISGTVVRTVNGGTTWVDVSVPGWEEPFQGVAAVDGQTAWVSGGSNASGYCGLFKTIDGGIHWVRQTNGAVTNVNHLLGLASVDADHVWGIGGHELLIYTEDGGDLWQLAYQGGADFKDGNEIYVRGNNEVYAAFDSFVQWSRDNGATWTNHSTADYTMDISSPTGTNIWAVEDGAYGCVIHYSPDGGLTWEEQYTNSAYHFTTTMEMRWREDPPAELYVDAAGTNPVPPYDSWETAAQTIQEAVDAAVDGDWVWVTNGLYDSGTRLSPISTCMNRVVITNDITVQSVNGPGVTLIVGAPDPSTGSNGVGAVRGVFMSAGLLSGFTITNGHTHNNQYYGRENSGGGIIIFGGSGIVSNCMLYNNSAIHGGGCYGGSLIQCAFSGNVASNGGGSCESALSNCSLYGNLAVAYGGGSFSGTLDNCMLSNNAAIYRGGGSVYATASDCILVRNSAKWGGGSYGGTLNNCSLRGNSAFEMGGGSCNGMVSNCMYIGNTSDGDGGGSYGGTLKNCLLDSNSANERGGGSMYGELINCTLSGNSAGDYGGGGCYGSLTNCIAWGNSAFSGSNWYDDSPHISYTCTKPLPDGAGNMDSEPLFVDTTNGNFRLEAISPCNNAGINSLAPGNTDLDGNPRIVDGIVDMGAYENPTPMPLRITILNGSMVLLGEVQAITIEGTCSEWVSGTLTWTNDATGSHGSFASASNWWISNVQLDFGDNTITVSGTNTVGDSTFDCVVITRSRMHGGNSPVHYVSPSGGNIWPYTNWADAATIIQDSVDTAMDGDTVLVTNGVYNDGSRALWSSGLSRVVISNSITVRSVNGPNFTTIAGARPPENNAVRGVHLSGGVLAGFTITNGYVESGHNFPYDYSGGGVLVYPGNGVVSDCIIQGNYAAGYGGASVWGTLKNCVLNGNISEFGGGGSSYGTLFNCTLLENSAGGTGVGSYNDTLRNCIVYSNPESTNSNWQGSTFSYSCTTPLPPGDGNITNDPQFVDAAASNFHLQDTSPCIDAGSNALMASAADLDGIPRPLDGNANGSAIVDMGCYEYMNASADSDGDNMTDGDETIAVTDPTDAGSYFHVIATSNLPPLRMFFMSSTNRLYSLQATTNLMSGAWTNLPGQEPRPGVGGLDWMEISNGLRMGCWRLRVGLP